MRSPSLSVVAVLALFGLGVVMLQACPGAQVKGGPSGGIDIVLRRVDVVKAGYDKLEVKVIVGVNNGTDRDVDVEASADLALVGPGVADSEGDDQAPEAGEEGAEGEGQQEPPAATPLASGLDGARHKGTGSGTAAANNTSELPITITLPLPSDPAVLEQVLSWKKGRVHIAGRVKAGGVEQTIGGERDVATPQLPEFKLKSAQIAKLDEGVGGEAFFTLLLDNRNDFEVVVDKVAWKISIKDKEVRTKEDESTSVPASAVEEYNETVELSEKAFPAKELKALLKQPSVPYAIEATIEVRGIKKVANFSGDMKFPR